MKSIVVAVAMVAMCGCKVVAHKAKVILHETREEGESRVLTHNVYTTIECQDTGHRLIWQGNWGNTGDIFTIYEHHDFPNYWHWNP